MDTRERCVGETGCAGCLRDRVDAGRKWRHSMRYGATQRDTAGEEEKTGWDEGGARDDLL